MATVTRINGEKVRINTATNLIPAEEKTPVRCDDCRETVPNESVGALHEQGYRWREVKGLVAPLLVCLCPKCAAAGDW